MYTVFVILNVAAKFVY